MIKRVNRILEDMGIEGIEAKENCKFKMTKNDFVVVSDEVKIEGLEKLKNIIILTKDKDYKYIWRLSNMYKTVDIIDGSMSEEYIAKRILKMVGREE